MAYLQDFYLLDVDNSYREYVISELKYDNSDILLLEVDYIAKFQIRTVALSPLTSSHKSSKH